MGPEGKNTALHLFKWSLSDNIVARLFNDLSLLPVIILTKNVLLPQNKNEGRHK
jgi:hypothetical protein